MAGQFLPPVDVPATLPPVAGDDNDNQSIVTKVATSVGKYVADTQAKQAADQKALGIPEGYRELPPPVTGVGKPLDMANDYLATAGQQVETGGKDLLKYLKDIWTGAPPVQQEAAASSPFGLTPQGNQDKLPLKEAYNAAGDLPNPTDRRQDIAEQSLTGSGLGPRGGILTPVDEYRSRYGANPLGDVNTVLQPLMVPVYAGGSLVAAAASTVPEKGTKVGDFIDNYASHYYANNIAAWRKAGPLGIAYQPAIVAKSLNDARTGPPDESLGGEIGHNAFRALSSGEVWRQTQADRSSEFSNAALGAGIGGTAGALLGPQGAALGAVIGSKLAPEGGAHSYPMLRGVHVLDKFIPPELANRLLAESSSGVEPGLIDGQIDQAESLMWSILGTHAGREFIGGSMEAAGDPINFWGPANGAQRILHRGQEFEMSAPVLRGAASVEDALGTPFVVSKGVMADLVHGDEGIKAAAKAKVEDAFTELSRRYVDAQGQLNLELAKATPDDVQVKILKNRAEFASQRYTDLERSTSLLRAGSPNGYMQPRGIFAVSIPGSDQTYFASQLASPITDSQYGQRLVRRVSDGVETVRRDLLDNRFYKVDYENLEKRAAQNKLNKVPETTNMSAADRYAWAAKKYGGLASDKFYRETWQGINNYLGSRFIEPLLMRASEAHHAVASASKEAATRFALSTPYQRIAKGLNSEAYQKGQEAVTRVLSKLQSRYDVLNRYIRDIAKQSNLAHGYQLRQKAYEMAKVEDRLAAVELRMKDRIPHAEQRQLRAEKFMLLNRKAEVEYWGTPEHTSADIMDRAMDYVLRGAGKEAPIELRPAIDEAQKFYDEVQQAFDPEDRVHVSNLMAAVERRGVGDPTMENHLRAGMAQAKEYLLNGDFERLQALADARLFQVGGLTALVDDLSPQGLASVLEQILKLGGPVVKNREAIAGVLSSIIPDAGMVEDLLGRATVITGEKNPYDAVMTLANMMRGNGGDMGKEIAGLTEKWETDAGALRRLSMGEYTPELRDLASKNAVTSSVERRVASLRSQVGEDDWEAFLNWASDETRGPSEEWEPYISSWKRAEALAMAAADARGGAQAAISKLRAQLTDNMIGAERVAAAMGEAGKAGAGAAKVALIKALDRILDVEYPVVRALANDIADQILKDAAVLESPEKLVTGANARNDIKDFETEIKKVEPQFRYPVDSKYNPPTNAHERAVGVATKMNDFEAEVFKGWLDIKKKHNLTQEEALYVAMSALVHSPDIPNALEWKDVAKRFDGVFGTRFMEVPPDMQGPVKLSRALIASYEDMFDRAGLDILKTPYRLMKEEGVVEYAPKIRVTRSDMADGPDQIRKLNNSSAWIGDTIDKKFDTELDQAKKRSSVGTARELNAWADDADNHIYSYRPAFLLSKYLKTNKAVSAKEFLDELALLGVVKTFGGDSQVSRHVAAMAQGHVPLFREGDEQFAGFIADTQEVREAYKLEGILAGMGDADRMTVEHLAEQKQFEQAAAMMQEAHGKEVPIEQVERYYGDNSVRRMYVPDSFYQSMHDVFEISKDGGPFQKGLEESARWIKPWLTMIHTAYHTINFSGNTFQRIVDLGMYGAMNFKTLAMSSRLQAAGVVADRWGGGSLAEAMDVLSKGHKGTERTGVGKVVDEVVGFADDADAAAWRTYADAYGLDRASKEGLDLGDGLLRPADEALRILRENKVIDMHFGHQIDVGVAEALVGENHLLGRHSGVWQAARAAGDAAIVALPMLAGSPVPVTVGFKYGEMLGKSLENSAKVTNFVGSMRRVPSIQDAAANVARRYFQYLDLTGAQRMHLRNIFPFFTWPLKNLHVQFEQMTRNPAFYSWFSRFMLEQAPRISQAIEADHENTAYVPLRPYDQRAGMDEWGYGEFRIPVGESIGGSRDAVLTGFKDPLSSMVTSLGDWGSVFVNPLKKAALYGGKRGIYHVMAQLHWYLSLVPDLYFNDKAYDSMAGRPIGDETQAYDLRTVLERINSIPVVGKPMAGWFCQHVGFYQLWERDGDTGEIRPVPYGAPGVNYLIKKMQLSRLLKAATRSTEDQMRFTAATLLNEQVHDSDGIPYDPNVDDTWNTLGVLLGPRVEIESPFGRQQKMDRNIDAATKAEQKAAGATSSYEKSTIKE